MSGKKIYKVRHQLIKTKTCIEEVEAESEKEAVEYLNTWFNDGELAEVPDDECEDVDYEIYADVSEVELIPPDAFEEEVETGPAGDFKEGEWFKDAVGYFHRKLRYGSLCVDDAGELWAVTSLDTEDIYKHCTPVPAGDEPFEIVMMGADQKQPEVITKDDGCSESGDVDQPEVSMEGEPRGQWLACPEQINRADYHYKRGIKDVQLLRNAMRELVGASTRIFREITSNDPVSSEAINRLIKANNAVQAQLDEGGGV